MDQSRPGSAFAALSGFWDYARWLSAISIMSKLRIRLRSPRSTNLRLKIRGTFCSDTPPCERKGTVNPDRSCLLAALPSTVSLSPSTTRSPIRSSGNSNRWLACVRVKTASTPSIPARKSFPRCSPHRVPPGSPHRLFQLKSRYLSTDAPSSPKLTFDASFTVPKSLDSASLIISLELPITLLRHLE